MSDTQKTMGIDETTALACLKAAWEDFQASGGERMGRDDFAHYALQALADPRFVPEAIEPEDS